MSQWSEQKKSQACALRRRGWSIRDIEKELNISRSTLSGWFKKIELSQLQKERLNLKWKKGLIKAREKAADWHRSQRLKRLESYSREAELVLEKLDLEDKAIIELALAILYLGEGGKKSSEFRMSNSNPIILKTAIKILNEVYNISSKQIRCGLNLRADQKPKELRKFWSKELKIPEENFTYIIVDKRTSQTKTYSSYKGVCMIRTGTNATKERLMKVAEKFCKKMIS